MLTFCAQRASNASIYLTRYQKQSRDVLVSTSTGLFINYTSEQKYGLIKTLISSISYYNLGEIAALFGVHPTKVPPWRQNW